MTDSDRAKSFTLSEEDKRGIRDFYAVYEQNYDVLQTELMQLLPRVPHLARVIGQMSREQFEENARAGQARMRTAIIDGDWEPLAADQRQQGAAYAAMGIPFREWYDLVNGMQVLITPHLVRAYQGAPERLIAALQGMCTYLDMAMCTVGEEYLRTKERIITQQQAAIEELSTPVLLVAERLLLVPLVGVLDTARARRLTEQLLHAVRAQRAKVVVIDITGVAAVDSKVANHIFQTVSAARLMGARAIVTGLSAEVATALVALGVEIDRLTTAGDLQEGLEEARLFLQKRAGLLSASPSVVE